MNDNSIIDCLSSIGKDRVWRCANETAILVASNEAKGVYKINTKAFILLTIVFCDMILLEIIVFPFVLWN